MSVSQSKRETLRALFGELEEKVLVLMCDSHEKGRMWEQLLAEMAASRGLSVEPGEGRGDLKINGVSVQCKHIDATRDGDVIDISNMRPVMANDGLRGYLAGEYGVLALRHKDSLFFVPASFITDEAGKIRGRVRISSIRQFESRWEVFESGYAPPSRETQHELPI